MQVKMRECRRVLIVFAIVLSAAFTTGPVNPAAEPINVYVVNYPLKYFAEQIGGAHVKVTFPAPQHVDPAYWIPDIATIGDYQQADLILLNGARYAKWTKKVSLPRSKIVDTSRKFKDRYITIEGAVSHSHGPEGEHAHEEMAFTVWLDFKLAAQQADAIAKALNRQLPHRRKMLAHNLAALKKDILALDMAIRDMVRRNPSRPLVASHPVYNYLTRGYGLNIKSVHFEPDEFPGDHQWMELQKILKDHPAKWMIWEDEPIQASVDRLKAHVVDSLVFNPCMNVPEQGDFLTIMHKNVENLRPAFGKNEN